MITWKLPTRILVRAAAIYVKVVETSDLMNP